MRVLAFVTLLLLLTACDDAELYNMHARDFLVQQGVSDEVIERLIMQAALEPEVIEILGGYENSSVLHLVAANPGTPLQVLEKLARHEDMNVRLGVAVNPNTPLELLLGLRTPGRYSVLNTALARNPELPPGILLDMYQQHESLLSSFAMNPHTPPEVLRAIARDGEDLDRVWLAGNPNLPEDVVQQLAQDASKVVRTRLKNRNLPDVDGMAAVH